MPADTQVLDMTDDATQNRRNGLPPTNINRQCSSLRAVATPGESRCFA
jgi:hypothetical protein